jgi:hypothetical protein
MVDRCCPRQIEEIKGLMEEMDIDSMEVELEVEVEVDEDGCIDYTDDEEYVTERYGHTHIRGGDASNSAPSASSPAWRAEEILGIWQCVDVGFAYCAAGRDPLTPHWSRTMMTATRALWATMATVTA